MTLRQRQGLYIGIYSGVMYTLISFLWKGDSTPIRIIITGTIFGVAFGYINYKMWRSNDSYAERITAPPLEPDEHIIHEGPASHYNLANGFQGKLFLTDKRLIFIPQE